MRTSILKKIIAGCILGCMLAGCASYHDVAFARRLTKHLIDGRYLARSAIDWSVLKMLDKDIGAEYSKLKNENEKLAYQRAFIDSFSREFKARGAKFKAFYNWAIVKKSAAEYEQQGIKVVKANCFNDKTVVLFFIAHKAGRRKLAKLLIFFLAEKGEV